jgi:hypothetical protein
MVHCWCKELFSLKMVFFIFAVLGFELRAYTLTHSTRPFFGWVFFEIGTGELFCLAWLQTSILLISASRLARITGVSHRLPTSLKF